MIEYIVEVTVDPQHVTDWVDWMKTEHIPDVLSTGLFLGYTFLHATSSNNIFFITYRCESLRAFKQYQRNHAKEKQSKHSQLFGEVTTAKRRVQIVTSIE